VLNSPNELMTTSELIAKTIWLLFLNHNAYIIPTYTIQNSSSGKSVKVYTGLYPIKPQTVQMQQDEGGTLWISFGFATGYTITLLYEDVIHLRLRYGTNDYFGGNEYGTPDNKMLLDTLDLNKQLLDGIAKTMHAAAQINGIININTMMGKKDAEQAIKDFNELLQSDASGFMVQDLKSEYVPIKRDINFVDPDTVKFIDEKILRFYGVSLPILSGDYTPAQFEAFYDKTLEPLIVSMSQAFSKVLFSPRSRSFGNEVVFYPGEMVFMSTAEKLQMVRLLGDSGTIFENEKRIAFGFPAIPELEGVRMQSLNYIDTAEADQYQRALRRSEDDASDQILPVTL